MKNREAFNKYLDLVVQRQLKFVQQQSDEDLIQCTIENRDYGIHVDIGGKLSYFKAMTAGMPVGNKDTVAAWLEEEASPDIPWEKML